METIKKRIIEDINDQKDDCFKFVQKLLLQGANYFKMKFRGKQLMRPCSNRASIQSERCIPSTKSKSLSVNNY
jgi:hypothetical protein